MLATPGEPPESADWLHEVKWDGMRVLADVSVERVRLFSRSGRDISASFPELADVGGNLQDALIDGEIIALDAGMPSFEALAERMHVSEPRRAAQLAEAIPVTVMSFDLLRLYGVELLARPLSERRASLDKLELPERHWRHSPLYDDGAVLFKATLEQGLEGIVSKRRRSTYQPGRRSPDWIKAAHRRHQVCVVGGWRPEIGSAGTLGALLIGVPDSAGKLLYAGRVGSGLDQRTAQNLHREFSGAALQSPPFDNDVPAVDANGAFWCEPRIVIEVRHTGWTGGGRLRQPVFRGIREDMEVDQVRREP
jgi:bifunctional non-homologous end joining protein LigD